jgi:hypothetical protein
MADVDGFSAENDNGWISDRCSTQAIFNAIVTA